MNRHAAPNLKAEKIIGGVATDQRHDSAHKHVSGQAVYIDDMPEPAGALHGCLGLSGVAHGAITSIDLSAVRAAPGVVDVLTAKDVPGENDISPTGRHDEPVLADGKVEFHGQPIFAVIAETREQARRACRLARIEYEELPAIIDIDGLDPVDGRLVTPPLTLKRGDAAAAIAAAPHRLKGRMRVGGQDHFYLEGQIALAVPGEDQDVTVYSSTQHPSEVQHMVAHALGIPSHAVTVEIRRMGGGFGGKETQSNQFAAIAAIAAKRTRAGRQDQAGPRRRHDRDRQAARLPDRLRGRLRRRGQHCRRRLHLCGALRLFVGPFRTGHRSRAVPLRQCLFLPGGACQVGAALHQHRLQHRLSRLRRPAGHGRGRAGHRRGGVRARQGCRSTSASAISTAPPAAT